MPRPLSFASLAPVLLIALWLPLRDAQAQMPPRPVSPISCPAMTPPRMPLRAAREGIEGDVTAMIRVERGVVTEVTIRSGPEVFHDAVAQALRGYRCSDVATPFMAQQTFSFRPEGSPASRSEDHSLPAFLAGVPDVDSIRRFNGRALVRAVFRHPQPQGAVSGGRSFRSSVMLMELDCRQRSYRNLATVLHVGLDGDGDAASTHLDGPIAQLGSSPREAEFLALVCDAPAADSESPSAGATIRTPDLPLDRRYAQLNPAELGRLRAAVGRTAEGDEPPYPAAGLRSLREALAEAQRGLRVTGTLRLTAWIGVDGNASAVTIDASPSPELANFANVALRMLRFRPAVCDGRACVMAFPLQVEFEAR